MYIYIYIYICIHAGLPARDQEAQQGSKGLAAAEGSCNDNSANSTNTNNIVVIIIHTSIVVIDIVITHR